MRIESRRLKIAARSSLLAAVILGGLWLGRLDFATRIPTDVLELIPRDEREPELTLLRSLASEEQARVALFALQVPRRPEETDQAFGTRRDRVGTTFAAALRTSGAFSALIDLRDATIRDDAGTFLFGHRLDLFVPDWLAQQAAAYARTHRTVGLTDWLAQKVVADLDAFLTTPEAVPFQELVSSDPLLLIPRFATNAADLPAPTAGSDPGAVLFWARTTGSPFEETAQNAVFTAVAKAEAAARELEPGVRLEWTAVSRFAAASRERIKHEMALLNIISIAAVLGIAALGVRRLTKALHLLPVVVCSLLGAWVVTTLCFPRVHVLVFVVGSLLGGVAIDYGFYLYLQPRREGEGYVQRVGRLIKPLLASALTTVLGFSLLFFSELPLIRHLGVFVSAGLLCALASALAWFAQIDEPVLETRAWVRARLPARSPWLARGLLAGMAVVAIVGPGRLHWHDDIRELEIPAVRLREVDRAVRARFGENADRALYLTRGNSPAAARAALDSFREWHQQHHPDAPLASLGFALPTPENWRALPERIQALPDFLPALRRTLEEKGYDVESFSPFFEAWQTWITRSAAPDYTRLARDLAATLRGPTDALMHVGDNQTWFASMAMHAPDSALPANLATVSANQLESFNQLFSRYRLSALRLSAIGLGLVGASVFVLYGWRRGIRIFALPSGACLCCFGIFGLLGQTLNLFHLLGAFLGVCLSHNYAIFSAENAAAGEAPPPSIRFSALTTAASFGVLAFSHIPVVAALGATVATIVLLALVMVELGVVQSRHGR